MCGAKRPWTDNLTLKGQIVYLCRLGQAWMRARRSYRGQAGSGRHVDLP